MKTLLLMLGLLVLQGCATTNPETREFAGKGQIVTGDYSRNREVSPAQHSQLKDRKGTCEKVVSIYGEMVDLECN